MVESDTWPDTQLPSAELIMRQGPTPSQSFPVTKPAITIGRRAENDLVVADHEVSSRHASLAWDGSRWTIQDLGSANGTYVNGQRINTPQTLQDGDLISLGPGVGFELHAGTAGRSPPADARGTKTGAMSRPPEPPVTGPIPVPSADRVEPSVAGTAVDAGGTIVEAAPESVQAPSTDQIEPSATGTAVDTGATIVEAAPESTQAPSADQIEASVMGTAVDDGAAIVEAAPESVGIPGADQVEASVIGPPVDADATVLEARPVPSALPSEVQVKAVPYTPAPVEKQRRRQLALPLVAAMLVIGCLLAGALAAFFLWPGEADVPTVLIQSPQQGERVAVGQEVAVHLVARDEIVRVELWVDGQLQETQTSSTSRGNSPFPLLAHWQPLSAGAHTLIARAFNARGGQAQSSLTVEAIEPTDRGSPGDADGDAVGDAADACPLVSGLPEHSGCPDRDRDGIPDIEDRTLDQQDRGDEGDAPGTGGDDSDSDGVSDDRDGCPEEPGLPEHDGCPPPDPDEDADGDGTPDEDEGTDHPLGPVDIWGAVAADGVLVELQTSDFQVAQEYHHVFCYASLALGDVERYDLESLGGSWWETPADLGNRLVAVPSGEDLEVQVQCYGQSSPTPVEPPLPLGSFRNQHRPEEWEAGREISAESVGGTEGHWFRFGYRLCANSCEQSPSSAPELTLRYLPNRTVLAWQRVEDQSVGGGYWLYVDGNRVDRFAPSQFAQDVSKYSPACGATREFHMTAFRGHPLHPDWESPPSNMVHWEGDPCPRTVRVTFEDLITRNLARLQEGEEAGGTAGTAGPIRGNFWVAGNRHEDLAFNAADGAEGYYVHSNDSHSIQEIFEWIRREQARGAYHAPRARYVTVQLGPDDDLTLGASIWDEDGHSTQWVLRASDTIAAEDITPGSYALEDSAREAVLQYRIEVLEGP